MSSAARLRIPVTEADHSQGPKDAPLELVEYGDYQCPFCGQAYPVVKRLQKEFKEHLRFVFRNFPLAIAHPFAMDAARAAEAAGLQGKFWEMHDLLYENQASLGPAAIQEFAATLGLNPEKFISDLSSPAVEERIARDLYGGARSGVNGTPTFYINGVRYEGDWSFPSLLTVLSSLLERLAA